MQYSTLGIPSILPLLCKILSHTDLIIIYIALGAHTQLDMKRQMQQNYSSPLLALKAIFQLKADFATDFIIDFRIDSVIDFIIDSVIEFVIDSEIDLHY